MNRIPGKRFFTAAIFAAAIFAAGCAADDKPPPPAPGAGAQPKLLSDLSTVTDAPIDPLGINTVPATGEGIVHESPDVSRGPGTFERDPNISFDAGTEKNPGTERLLNDKAAKFGNFCEVILDRLFARLELAEKTDEISRTKLPTDLKPVIVTAIMDKHGQLQEIILEQHSGKAKIDNLLIDVCKKAIFYENPPPDALSDDGNYKFTIKLRLENFASMDETHWSFKTDISLGLG
jgi:hypothetical protein